jgi:hypothetical protein
MSAKAFCKKTAAAIGWFIQNLPSQIDDAWLDNPDATKEHLKIFAKPPVKSRLADEIEKILERLSTAQIPAVQEFVAETKFRVGETVDGITVGWLGGNFKQNFLSKTEGAIAGEELAVNNLLKNSKDPAIIIELGGEEMVEVSLGQFWEYLKTADRTLWHVVYIRDVNNVLWAVHADWDVGKLYVEASALGNPRAWRAGGRFLSR